MLWCSVIIARAPDAMTTEPAVSPSGPTAPADCILTLRGQRVVLDSDLAKLYGVPTKRLNEQVRRNAAKFPADFMFQLTREEAENVRRSRSQFATLKRGQNLKYVPMVFTEFGAIQAANVLNSAAAIRMSVAVVRAFVELRHALADHRVLAEKLAELDARVGAHDEHLAAIIAAIRELTQPPGPAHDRRIGFHHGNR